VGLWAESPQYDSLGCSEHRERRPRKQIARLCARPERPEQSTHSHPVSRPYRAERIVWASSPGALRFALHPRLSRRGPSALQIVQSPVRDKSRAPGPLMLCANRILSLGEGLISDSEGRRADHEIPPASLPAPVRQASAKWPNSSKPESDFGVVALRRQRHPARARCRTSGAQRFR